MFVYSSSAFSVYFVEDLTDHVEGRDKVRTTVTNKHTHVITYFSSQGVIACKGTNRTVEYYIRRVFIQCFLHIERLQARGSEISFGIEVALHHVKFFVYFRKAFFRLNKYKTVHTVGNVHTYRRSSAMVHI